MMGERRRLVFWLVGILLSVVAVALWLPHLGGDLTGAVMGSPLALLLHVSGAVLIGVGAGSGALGFFYAVMALVLPVFGGLAVLGVGKLLGVTVEQSGDDEEFDIGNPVVSRPSRGAAPVILKPIVRLMREESAGEIGRMILGLSKGGAADRGHQILRRYQQDGDVELQFYAQNAQRGATEVLERQLKLLRDRADAEPENQGVAGALAEVLIALAGRRATSNSDANAYVRRALEILKPLEQGAKRAALEVRGYLTLGEAAGARKALGGLPEDDTRRARLEAEVLYAERDWAGLEKKSDTAASNDTETRTALAFWRKSA